MMTERRRTTAIWSGWAAFALALLLAVVGGGVRLGRVEAAIEAQAQTTSRIEATLRELTELSRNDRAQDAKIDGLDRRVTRLEGGER